MKPIYFSPSYYILLNKHVLRSSAKYSDLCPEHQLSFLGNTHSIVIPDYASRTSFLLMKQRGSVFKDPPLSSWSLPGPNPMPRNHQQVMDEKSSSLLLLACLQVIKQIPIDLVGSPGLGPCLCSTNVHPVAPSTFLSHNYFHQYKAIEYLLFVRLCAKEDWRHTSSPHRACAQCGGFPW